VSSYIKSAPLHSMNMPLLVILSFGHLVTDLSQGALPILLPFFKEAFHLTYTQVGSIVLIANLLSSIIQPAFGYFSDRTSSRWLLPTGVIMSGLGMAMSGISSSFALVVAAIAFSGFGVAAYHPEASKNAYYASGSKKGTGFSVFSVGGNLGFALGAIFMTYLLTRTGGLSNTTYFLVPSLITTCILIYILPQLPQSTKSSDAKQAAPSSSGLSFKKHMPLIILLLIIFLRSTIHSGITTYIPLYYISYLQSDATYASMLVSVFLVAGVIGTFAGGILSDRYGRRRVIFLSMLLMIPLLYLFSYSSGLTAVILLFIGGIALVATTSTCIVLAQEMLPNNVGMASGLTIGFSIGMGGAGVMMLGSVADHWGVPMVFSVMNVLPLFALGLTLLLPKDNLKKSVGT
jgi:MFS transporter, FSR family, fosmidomycin resistance protein